MIPSLRPVLPLFDTAPRWGNNIRLRPRHVFHNQRSLSHDTKSQKERFPYYIKGLGLTRETLLRRLSFPREYMPYWIRICLTTFSVPLLLIGSLDLIRLSLYRFWGNRNLPRVDKGSEGNSYTALLFYVFGIIRLLSILMRPWGLIQLNQGPSMQPTLRARPAPSYASYAYIDRRDVRRGDVVVVLPPERYNKGAFICKRIAGLGGDRIRVTRYSPQKIPHRIVHVPFGHCFLVGDNPSSSNDSRKFGTVPIESILAKMQWRLDLDGVSWVDHDQHPWLQNKAIEHLPPANDGLPNGEDLTPQLKKGLNILPRANEKPLPSSSPPKKQQKAKKQRKDPRKKS